MKKRVWAGLATGLVMLGMSGVAQATLTTIGTVGYDSNGNSTVEAGESYNLIWDDDNNGNSVVWMDYSHTLATWANQNTWAARLNTAGGLNYTLNAGYTVDFGSNTWRLPTTVDGDYSYGYTGSTTAGYNITNSEMGHLFYTELGNQGYYNTNGTTNSYSAPDYFLTSVGDFDHLTASWYWSGTEYAADPLHAWDFTMDYGSQSADGKGNSMYGLAVRSGQVTYSDPNAGPGAAPVPEPATMLLLGTGLAGLVGGRLKKRRQGRAA